MAVSPKTCTSIGCNSNHVSLFLPTLISFNSDCFVKTVPDVPTEIQSSPNILSIVSTSTWTMASPMSCPSCLMAATADASVDDVDDVDGIDDAAGVSAQAWTAKAQTDRT